MEARVTRRLHDALAEPMDSALRRALRFGIAGVASTLLYALLANLFAYATAMRPLTASILAYAIAIAASYVLQSRFTFRVANDPPAQIGSFVVVSLGGLALSTLIMLLLCEGLGLPVIAGTALVCITIPVANYLLFGRWVFVRKPCAHPSVASPRPHDSAAGAP